MINVLIPLKTENDNIYNSFKTCFESYYQHLKEFDVEYIICDDSDKKYKDLTHEFLVDHNINFRYVINQGNTFYDVISTLISNLKSKYFLFILDDVEVYDRKNIFTPAINAFEKDEKLIQVMIGCSALLKSMGHYPFCNQSINMTIDVQQGISSIENITFNAMKECNDVIWSTNLNNRDIFKYDAYTFSYWNTIMRSDAFKELNEHLKVDNRSSRTFHGYAQNCSFHTPNYIFEQDYKVGWLNFENYIYPHGRADSNVTKELLFDTTQKREIKKQ